MATSSTAATKTSQYYDNGNVDEGDVMDDVGEVTGEGNNDEPSSTATSPTSPTSSSPQSTSISATSTTATATSTPRSTTTVARRLQRRRRDRRERRGTVVDDNDGALVSTMESAEAPIPRTKVLVLLGLDEDGFESGTDTYEGG